MPLGIRCDSSTKRCPLCCNLLGIRWDSSRNRNFPGYLHPQNHIKGYESGEDWSPRSGDKEAYAEMMREKIEASRKHLEIEDPWEGVERNQCSITSSDAPRVLSGEYVEYTNDLSPRSSDWGAFEDFFREEEAMMAGQYSLREVEHDIGRLLTNPVPHIASSEANNRELEEKVRQLEERVGDLEQKNMELEMRLGFLEQIV